jgi:hypothetical protein
MMKRDRRWSSFVAAMARFTLTAMAVVALDGVVLAAPPKIYESPFLQSPVRAEPDDLLLLAGTGFSVGDVVVYVRLSNTTLPLVHPSAVPSSSTAAQGVAPVVNYSSAPGSLAIRMPAVTSVGRSYALWVVNSSGEWSNGVRINDARPLWISPDVVYETAAYGGLPRQLKVIGRNLKRVAGSSTRVRLKGPYPATTTVYNAVASDDNDAATSIERYVARINLPPSLLPGTYTAEVSRDSGTGTSWVTVGQPLVVSPDPGASQSFSLSNYGCLANDGVDDTGCLLQAINAAAPVSGTVVLGPGDWHLNSSALSGVHPQDGIVLPVGVSLEGDGSSATALVRATTWSAPSTLSVRGSNRIKGIYFADEAVSAPSGTPGHVQIGASDVPWATVVENVTITENVFDGNAFAIVSALRRMRHVFITSNTLGGRIGGLYFAGDPNLAFQSRLDDSVIWNNSFKPGGGPPPIASQIGMSYHLDFSNNRADGRTTALLAPGELPGWRAAFFFHMSNNHEMVLISQNEMSCTGDRDGDGEAIVYDTHPNTYAFSAARKVQAAADMTITVAGPLSTTSPGSFAEHWVQITSGPGLGQVRKIVSHTDPSLSQVTFTLNAAWDVIPHAEVSLAMVAKQFWQTYVVDNEVDIRGCQKTNLSRKSGLIAASAMTADSVIEGNTQYESDGVMIYAGYDSVGLVHTYQYFNEVRGNTVLEEFDYSHACSSSGIWITFGAQSDTVPVPATPMYGIDVSHNIVERADYSGGVSLAHASGYVPGSTLSQSVLMHHNEISDLPIVSRTGNCDLPGGIGVDVLLPVSWDTVLYKNDAINVPMPIRDLGTDTCNLTSTVTQCQ